MEIVDFTKEYMAEARWLAAENYEEERALHPRFSGIVRAV